MKSIALQATESGRHAGFWTLLRTFLHVPVYHGITHDTGRSPSQQKTEKVEEDFFSSEDELENYLRSFRD